MPELEFDFFADPLPITETMRTSLAKLYADTELRNYLVRSAQAAHQNALTALDVGQNENARFYANRAKVLKQLVEKGKSCFITVQTKERKVGKIVDTSVGIEP